MGRAAELSRSVRLTGVPDSVLEEAGGLPQRHSALDPVAFPAETVRNHEAVVVPRTWHP